MKKMLWVASFLIFWINGASAQEAPWYARVKALEKKADLTSQGLSLSLWGDFEIENATPEERARLLVGGSKKSPEKPNTGQSAKRKVEPSQGIREEDVSLAEGVGVVTLRGRYEPKEQGFALTEARGFPIVFLDQKKKNSGKFRMRIPFVKEQSHFELAVVSPKGKVKRFKFQIQAYRWPDFVTAQTSGGRKRWGLQVGLGYTQGVYQQTPNQLYQQSSLTLKVGYAWAAPRVPLDLAGNIFGTVAPLVDNSPESTGWVLGMNVRLGVRVTPRYWRWRLSLALGYYNVSFLDSNRAFGFTFLNGPEVYPALSFRWKKNRLGVYFKFAPVWNGQGFNSLASRELATGFSYSRSLKQGFDVVVAVDYAQLKYDNVLGSGRLDSITLTSGIAL
jgi:hypothetical protein